MKKIISIFLSSFVLLLLASCSGLDEEASTISNGTNTSQDTSSDEDLMVSQVVYPHDEVVEVNIEIDLDTYDTLIENAMDEEYYNCNITYNDYTLYNVAIRTKGNSSLRDVAYSGGNRFSFNVDLNYYEDQDLYGIDKLILNNIYKDPSYMAEYVTYEALDYLDTVSSRTTYVSLSINGEYFGLYLSVEQVGNEFLDLNFDYDEGQLYKPDIGTGANLEYISDTAYYSALVDTNNDETNNEAIINLMKSLSMEENIENFLDVDSYLKYLAVSTYTVNLDSYQGGVSHNYYLYNNQGTFEWIGWDFNMAFNGFPMINLTDEEAIGYLIDEPTMGSLSDYALTNAVFSNEEYLNAYHEYLQMLVDGYFNTETFNSRVDEIYGMIKEYVETDPSTSYTYDEFEEAISGNYQNYYSITQFVNLRTSNVQAQLSGEITSTNNGEGNESLNQTRPNKR